jgi:hypothetical protein
LNDGLSRSFGSLAQLAECNQRTAMHADGRALRQGQRVRIDAMPTRLQHDLPEDDIAESSAAFAACSGLRIPRRGSTLTSVSMHVAPGRCDDDLQPEVAEADAKHRDQNPPSTAARCQAIDAAHEASDDSRYCHNCDEVLAPRESTTIHREQSP